MSSNNDVPSPCAATGRGGTAPKPILKKPSGHAPGAQAGTPPAAASAKGRVGKGNSVVGMGMGVGMGGGAGGRRQGGPRSAEEARAIAVHHAQVLENRKQLELSILASVEHLLEYPTVAEGDDGADVAGLKRHLAHFQPADLDDLVEERNIACKCGYPLCARPNALQPTPPAAAAKYRVLRGRGASTPIVVEARRLERFCGDDCARRALWIRVQLSEQPAWLRPAGSTGHSITLLEEEKKREPAARHLSDPAFRANLGKLADELRHIGISNTGLVIPNPSSSSSSSSSPSHKTENEQQQEEEEDDLVDRLQRGAISETGVALQYAAVAPVAKELVTIAERPPPSVGAAEPPNTNAVGAETAALAVEGYTPQGPNKDLASRWKQVVTSGKQKHVAFDEKITA